MLRSSSSIQVVECFHCHCWQFLPHILAQLLGNDEIDDLLLGSLLLYRFTSSWKTKSFPFLTLLVLNLCIFWFIFTFFWFGLFLLIFLSWLLNSGVEVFCPLPCSQNVSLLFQLCCNPCKLLLIKEDLMRGGSLYVSAFIFWEWGLFSLEKGYLCMMWLWSNV